MTEAARIAVERVWLAQLRAEDPRVAWRLDEFERNDRLRVPAAGEISRAVTPPDDTDTVGEAA